MTAVSFACYANMCTPASTAEAKRMVGAERQGVRGSAVSAEAADKAMFGLCRERSWLCPPRSTTAGSTTSRRTAASWASGTAARTSSSWHPEACERGWVSARVGHHAGKRSVQARWRSRASRKQVNASFSQLCGRAKLRMHMPGRALAQSLWDQLERSRALAHSHLRPRSVRVEGRRLRQGARGCRPCAWRTCCGSSALSTSYARPSRAARTLIRWYGRQVAGLARSTVALMTWRSLLLRLRVAMHTRT